MREARDGDVVFDFWQRAEGIRIGRWAVFTRVEPLFEIQAALDEVPAVGDTAVMTGEEPPFGIEIEAEVVTAAFGEDFVYFLFRVISPDHASFGVDAMRIWRIDAGAGDAT